MKIRLLLTLVGLAISFAMTTIAQQTSAPDPQLRQQIVALLEKFTEAWNNNDASALAALYTKDAVEVRAAGGVTRAGVFSGRQALEKMFAADFALYSGKMVNKLVQVYAMGDNDICAIGNSSAGTWKAYTLTAYVRALDGTWRIYMTYVNPL